MAATLLAAALRFANTSGLAIEHFDEGVYASNLWCPDSGDSYPDRHLFAPPGLPRMIEECHVWFGASNLTSLLPALVAGILVIPLVGCLARDWFGASAGIAAMLLAATSDIHILFSRTALTDVPWITCLVLATWLTSRGLASGNRGQLVGAGLSTALGWWTKYAGWLPLAIGLSAILAVALLSRSRSIPVRQWLIRFAVILGVATLAISPLFLALQPGGGYSEIAANHARYVVGLNGWFASATFQWGHMTQLESPLGWLAVLLVGFCLPATGQDTRRFTWNVLGRRLRHRAPKLAACSGLVAIAGFPALVIVAAATSLGDAWRHVRRHPDTEPTEDNLAQSLAWGLVASWWISLTLTTPLYHPYPRLVLPWLVAGWLLVGRQLDRWMSQDHGRVSRKRRLAMLVAGGVAIGCAIPGRFSPLGFPALAPRTSMMRLAQSVLKSVEDQSPAGRVVIRVWGEPALFFQLSNSSSRRILMQPTGGPQVVADGQPAPTIPVFLVVGPHVRESGAVAGNALQDYNAVDSFQTTPALQVQLNQPPARRGLPMSFHLYRWDP